MSGAPTMLEAFPALKGGSQCGAPVAVNTALLLTGSEPSATLKATPGLGKACVIRSLHCWALAPAGTRRSAAPCLPEAPGTTHCHVQGPVEPGTGWVGVVLHLAGPEKYLDTK